MQLIELLNDHRHFLNGPDDAEAFIDVGLTLDGELHWIPWKDHATGETDPVRYLEEIKTNGREVGEFRLSACITEDLDTDNVFRVWLDDLPPTATGEPNKEDLLANYICKQDMDLRQALGLELGDYLVSAVGTYEIEKRADFDWENSKIILNFRVLNYKILTPKELSYLKRA